MFQWKVSSHKIFLHIAVRHYHKYYRKNTNTKEKSYIYYFSSPPYFPCPSSVLGPLFVFWFLRTSASVCFFIPVSYSAVFSVFVFLPAVRGISLLRAAAAPVPVPLLTLGPLPAAFFVLPLRVLPKELDRNAVTNKRGKHTEARSELEKSWAWLVP